MNFWHDTWFQNYSLVIQFPLVYAKIKNDRVSIASVWNNGTIKLYLTRGVSNAMRIEKN